MMCIFLYLSFSIIILYIILNLSPMQVWPEELWRAKMKKKERKKKQIFPILYILWSSLEHHQDKEEKRNNKLKYSFP